MNEHTGAGEPRPLSTPIVRSTAIDSGITDWSLRTAVRTGDLDRLYRGMYAERQDSFVTDDGRVVRSDSIEARRDHYRRRVIAAAEFGEERKAASHQSAAALHKIPVLGLPDDIHFTADRHAGGRRKGRAFFLHASPLPPDEVTVVDGILTTTLARTAMDVARNGAFADALVVLDGALRAGATHEEIAVLTDRGRRRRGIALARQALTWADGRSESAGESLSRALMIRAGFLMPELQVEYREEDGEVFARVDFDWGGRVVGEFDGLVKYDDATDVVAEKRREDKLRALGIIVVRWTWNDLRNPDRFIATLHRAFTTAGLLAA
ncbi:hypothetical protein [Williamsia deligens]|uniref:Transcriptional regulator, AbiEi antitoxin, Type IV TA system n=1 Tax=Williamsia deligens TaxID=321325 RepID=A0ABW3G918_9NOCA|nr:hypothetical protein [Williamsia deligens]MCP2192572.1 Transcriptional regulator, AbiEi antitoxin, Type IV TA system [Williamsia deligens]